MEKIINIGGRLHNTVVGGALTGADEIKDDLKGKMQNVINQETDVELVRLDEAKQDKLTFDQTPTEGSNNPVTSGGVYAADAALQQAIEAILLLIPSAASALNQLADKAFVNSSIATATATFRGTYNLVTDLELTVSATHQQIATALASVISTADNNDYCFVQIPVSDQSTDIRVTERYKFDGTSWEYEYDLNNSGFTADQWGAINSGITLVLVGKLGGLPTAQELAAMFAGKQNTLTFDTTPTSGSNNPVTSGGLYAKFATIDAMIPTGADANNKLVAENRLVAYVTTLINALDATFDVTSADGHVTLRMTQTDGVITSVQVLTSDIASASALTTLTGRISTAESDIDALQDAYAALTQSDVVIVEGALPSTGQQNIIYRQIDQDHTPPQFYSDYMWNGTTWVLMATYMNAIDPRPKKGSQNLVTSGGVFDNMGALDVSELNATENPHTLATYADLSAALAAITSDYQKGGMSIKFVLTSDNKYVQYRLMADDWSTTVSDWQGVDEEPIVNSNNLAESGGVFKFGRELVGDSFPDITWHGGYLIKESGSVVRSDDSTAWKISSDIFIKKGQTITLHHTVPYANVGIVAIGMKNQDNTYTSLVQGSSTLTDYSYTAPEDCTIVLTTHINGTRDVDIKFNLLDRILNDEDDIAKLKADKHIIIVAAYDCSSSWNAKANFKAVSINDGIACIIRAINLADNGDIIMLSDGTFKSSDNSGVEISKSLTIIGQGISTFIERNNNVADITVDYDNVSAVVRNLNVKHAVNIAAKTDHSRYNSSILMENIWVDGERVNCEELNYILNSGFATLAISGTPYVYYATDTISSANGLPWINRFTYNTNRLPASNDINDRTLLLLPGTYSGTDGAEFNKTYPTRLIGLRGHETETIVERVNGNIAFRQTIYCSPSEVDNIERVVENISYTEVVGFSKCSNFKLINCYRDGIRIDDHYSNSMVFEVGKNKIFDDVSHAIFFAKTLATPENRATIRISGDIYQSDVATFSGANIDVEGINSAKILRVGQNQSSMKVNIYGAAPCVEIGGNFDGYFKNIDIVLAGCQKGIDIPALLINAKKARLENVRAYNLSFPSVAAQVNGEDVLIGFDNQHRPIRCVADANSSTGYTAHVYSPVFGTEVSTYEYPASLYSYLTQNTHLTVRKSDADMSTGWEDQDGGRRHGIEMYLRNDVEVTLINCEGYGSPWGFHNTRGFYVLGNPKLINCKGVGGGIGHRLHGILCHDNSEAELIGCIGIASPFAYLTPPSFNQHGVNYNGENSVGIKFQRQSASKLSDCIGYGNDMPMGHGIHADMRTSPKLFNCKGYNGGGSNSCGLCITEYATAEVEGGYFGQHTRIWQEAFAANNGNGMDVYPYKRPVRHDSTDDDVLFEDHWKPVANNTAQVYKIENITFLRGTIKSTSIGGSNLCFYDSYNGVNTLITSEVVENENGGYQYVNLPNQYIIESGHKLYVCFERDGSEIAGTNGIVTITLSVSEIASGCSGIYINQYWSHEQNIDPTAPPYNITENAVLSHITSKQDMALRIGANADIANKYIVGNSVFEGDVARDTATASDARVYNFIKIVNDVVTNI